VRYYRPFRIPEPDIEEAVALFHANLNDGTLTKGDQVRLFAEELSAYTGYEYVVPFAQGTHAIFALARWFRQRGYRKVRVPAFTWTSTYMPFRWCGFDVAFVDIDRETWLADFQDRKPDIDELFVPVDTFGSVYRLDERVQWVDSAQSLGSMWPDKSVTRIVSFSGSKLVTAGEGGAIFTQDAQIAKFARDTGAWFSRMPEASAIVGRAYLRSFREILDRKERISREYRKAFPGLQWQKIPQSTNHYVMAALCDTKRIKVLNPEWEYRDYYQGIVSEENERIPFSESGHHLPNTNYVSRSILAFPSFPDMDIGRIREMRT